MVYVAVAILLFFQRPLLSMKCSEDMISFLEKVSETVAVIAETLQFIFLKRDCCCSRRLQNLIAGIADNKKNLHICRFLQYSRNSCSLFARFVCERLGKLSVQAILW